MGFDRTKIRPTTLSTLKRQEDEYATKRPSRSGNFTNLSIEEGFNMFRIMPFHPDGGGSSYAEPMCTSWLSVNRPKRDKEGNVIEGEFALTRFPVFNSKVHGNLPKDLVEEYMRFAQEVAIANAVPEDKWDDCWKEITGDFKLKKKNGIKPTDVKVVYASKWEKEAWSPIGKLELPKSVQNLLIEAAIKFSSNDIATPDPYTDTEIGIAVIINNDPNAGFKRYSVDMHSKRDGMSLTYVPTPLTDAQLEEWSKLTPLYKLYVNSFKRSDFDYQVEGLKNFDDYLAKLGYPLNVFSYPEFLDIVEEIDRALPAADPGKEETRKEEPVAAPTVTSPLASKPLVVKPQAPKPRVVQSTPIPSPTVKAADHEEQLTPQQRLEKIKQKYGK